MEGWHDFFVAEVGASAALAGLIFVGVSINLTRILSLPRLPARAFEALLMLLSVLVLSSLSLVPEQSLPLLGAEVLVGGLVCWITVIVLDIDIWRKTGAEFRRSYVLLVAMNQIATLPYVIAGLVLVFGGAGGLYWLVPAMVFSFIKAILDAWVLLVEINR
jgi:hypothetical protein